MNLTLENVQPEHIPVFKELVKVLNIKIRKEKTLSNPNKVANYKTKNIA